MPSSPRAAGKCMFAGHLSWPTPDLQGPSCCRCCKEHCLPGVSAGCIGVLGSGGCCPSAPTWPKSSWPRGEGHRLAWWCLWARGFSSGFRGRSLGTSWARAGWFGAQGASGQPADPPGTVPVPGTPLAASPEPVEIDGLLLSAELGPLSVPAEAVALELRGAKEMLRGPLGSSGGGGWELREAGVSLAETGWARAAASRGRPGTAGSGWVCGGSAAAVGVAVLRGRRRAVGC